LPVIILLCVGKCCCGTKYKKEKKLKLLKEKIEKLVIDLNTFNTEILKDKSCVICFKDFTSDEVDISQHSQENIALVDKISKNLDKQLVVGLKCEHYFHYTCIFNWFRKKKSCPTCRQDVSEYIVL
jgi:hypothetical protein